MPRHRWILKLFVVLFILFPAMALAQKNAKVTSSAKAIQQYRSAVALQNREVYDLAVEEWRAFVEDHSEDPLAGKAHHYLGICLFQLGKFQKAEAAFELALANQRDSEQLRETLLHLGLAQYNRGQSGDEKLMKRSIQTFSRLMERYGDSKAAGQAYFYLAEAQYALGKFDAAADAYEKALRQNPDASRKAEILLGLGVTLQDLDQHKNAQQAFERLIRESPDEALVKEARMRRADALYELDKFEKAAQEFRKLTTETAFEFSDYAEMRYAACLFAQKEYRLAAAQYVTLPERFPNSNYAADATLAAGKSFYLAGAIDEARPWLKKSVKLSGRNAAPAAHWFARAEIDAGNPERTLEIIDSVLPKAKGDIRVDLTLDKADALYEMKGQRERASELYESIAKQHPKHESAAHALYMAAYSALDAKAYQRASMLTDTFTQSHRDHHLRADVLAIRAESELQQEHYQAAADLYESLVRQFGDHSDQHLWRVRAALCQNLRGNHKEVMRLLDRRAGSFSDPELKSEALFLLGAACYHQNDKRRAIQELESSLGASPKTAQADRTHLLLAKALRESGKRQAAAQQLSKLSANFPNSDLLDRALLELAELQSEAGEHREAAKTYGQLLRAFPDSDVSSDALYGQGWSLLQYEKYERAIDTFGALIKADSQWKKDAYYGRAVAFQELGKTNAALQDIKKYLANHSGRGSSRADAYYLAGLCYASQKQFDSAAENFRQALRSAPHYADADQVMYELAWALEAGKKETQAAETFRRIAKKFPNSRLAAESVFRAAEADYANDDLERAIQGFRNALQQSQSKAIQEQAAHKLGWSYYKRKDFEKAASSFRQQLEAFAEGDLAPDAQYMMGECYFSLDQPEQALAAYQKAQQPGRSKNQQLVTLSLLHAGQSAGRLKRWETSRQFLELLISQYPNSDLVIQAQYELAWAWQKSGETSKAAALYEQVAETTDSVVGARARFMLGELQFLNEDFETAIRTFFKVAYGYGHPKAPKAYRTWQADAMFEAARCCESTKRFEAASRLYADLVEFHPNSDKTATARTKLENISRR